MIDHLKAKAAGSCFFGCLLIKLSLIKSYEIYRGSNRVLMTLHHFIKSLASISITYRHFFSI